jgi:hypothetical protein
MMFRNTNDAFPRMSEHEFLRGVAARTHGSLLCMTLRPAGYSPHHDTNIGLDTIARLMRGKKIALPICVDWQGTSHTP